MTRLTLRRGAVVTATLCALVSPASAGIIVTEGDVAARGGRLLALSAADGPSDGAGAAAEGVVPGGTVGQITHKAPAPNKREPQPIGTPGSKVPTGQVGTIVKGAPPSSSSPGTDLDSPPADGWQCTSMPGGMQYCEPRGATGATGATEGAAGGGFASSEDAVSMALDDGCGGSPGGSGVLGLFAALAALGAARMRRRDVNG